MGCFLSCSRLFSLFCNSILIFVALLLIVACAGTNTAGSSNAASKSTKQHKNGQNELFASYDYLENVKSYFGDLSNNQNGASSGSYSSGDQDFINFFVNKNNYSDLTLKSVIIITDEKPVYVLSQMANSYAIDYDYIHNVNNIAVLYNDKIVTNNIDCKAILTTDSYSSIQYDNGFILANNTKNIEIFDPKNCASLMVRPNKFNTKIMFVGGLINFVQNDTFNVYPLDNLQIYSSVQMPYNIMKIFANGNALKNKLNFLLVADVKGDIGFYNATTDMIENGFKLGFKPAQISYTPISINKITGDTIYKLSAISDKKSTSEKTVLLNIILEGEKILDSASSQIDDDCILTDKTGALYCDDQHYNRSNIEILAPVNYTLYQEKNTVAIEAPIYKKKNTVTYSHATPAVYYQDNDSTFYLRDITGTMYKISAMLDKSNSKIDTENEQILKKCSDNEPNILIDELNLIPDKINSLKKIYLTSGEDAGSFKFTIGQSSKKGKYIIKNVCYKYAKPLKTYGKYTLYQQDYNKMTRLFFNLNE